MTKNRRDALYPGEQDPVITLIFVSGYFVATVLMATMLLASYLRLM